MNDDRLTCCGPNSIFEKKGDYFICKKCGKKYIRKRILYKNNDISHFCSEAMAVKKKLKGRKVNKVSDKYVGVLQANKYSIQPVLSRNQPK